MWTDFDKVHLKLFEMHMVQIHSKYIGENGFDMGL